MALSKPPVQDRIVIGQHYLVCDNENCNKNVQFYCNPCHRSMCEQCEEEHQKNPETKKHEVVPYRQRKYQLPVEKCKNHPTKDIDMFCEDCQIPVCSKCATQNHHKHALNDLETIYSEKFTLCLEEIFKIHQYFLPTSQNIQKDVKEDVKDLKTTMNKIRTSMRDEAETLKNLIDAATSDNLEQVNKVEELLKEKLQSQDKTYQDYISYLEDLVNEFNSYLSSKKVKNNPLIFSFSEHVNIQPIPETSKPIPPVFTAGQYSKEDVIKLLGRVTVPDTKSKIRKIKPTEIASTKLKSKERKEEREKSDVKQTLSPPLCVTKVREYTVPGVKSVHHVSFDESGRFWYSEWNGWNIVQTDQQGRMLLDIKTSGEFGYHTVTKDGDFIFTDKNKKVINGITLDNTVTEFIKTGDWEPICIHASHINGDLLVGMIKDGEAKVIRYTKTGKEIQNIQRDTNNQELYSNPRYLTENINSNICISDWNKRAVVVVNKSGQHRFSYNGQTSWFCPWGICTDKIGHILVCDCPILNNLFMFFNSTVHLLDQDGQLLSLLLTPQHGINYPRGVCVDDDNNIHVGQRFTNKVTVYKYLQG